MRQRVKGTAGVSNESLFVVRALIVSPAHDRSPNPFGTSMRKEQNEREPGVSRLSSHNSGCSDSAAGFVNQLRREKSDGRNANRQQCDRGTIGPPDATRVGRAWRAACAQDARCVFDRSRRFEPAQQGTIRRDGLDVCDRRHARVDSRRHSARKFARANPH